MDNKKVDSGREDIICYLKEKSITKREWEWIVSFINQKYEEKSNNVNI